MNKCLLGGRISQAMKLDGLELNVASTGCVTITLSSALLFLYMYVNSFFVIKCLLGFSPCEGFTICNYLYPKGYCLEPQFENVWYLLGIHLYSNIWAPHFVSLDMTHSKTLVMHLVPQLLLPLICPCSLRNYPECWSNFFLIPFLKGSWSIIHPCFSSWSQKICSFALPNPPLLEVKIWGNFQSRTRHKRHTEWITFSFHYGIGVLGLVW